MPTQKMVRRSVNYRKIWQDANGEIPVDSHGRSFDIHHIDGNPNNNALSNLVALSMEDHYNTHYNIGDYFACKLIALRMALTKDERSIQLSELTRRQWEDRRKSGWKTSEKTRQKMSNAQRLNVEKGIHPLQLIDNSRENHWNFDPSLYTFIHKKTLEVVTTTRYDLAKRDARISAKRLGKVVSGEMKSHQGWMLK
jgi:hypothetical protein